MHIQGVSARGMMEEKQLDFNQPFLSVRRSAPTPPEAPARRKKVDGSSHNLPPLPTYRSELKSGPVANPGTVPFLWERIPGKPKEGKRLQNGTAVIFLPPDAPKLPPGRSQKDQFGLRDSGKDSKVAREVEQPVPKHDISEEGSRDNEEFCSEDGAEEDFVDARDTFSRSDSFFLNCSVVSGLSGLDGPDSRSPRRFNTDLAARDFMMGRFLPAAKAMASETPLHAAWKPLPPAQETPTRPRRVSDNRAKEDCPVADGYRPNFPLRYVLTGLGGGESEDDDFDYYEDSSSAKVCGLLPRFCILNPVPGMKNMQPPRPRSARRVRVLPSSHKSSLSTYEQKTPSKEELNKDKFEPRSKTSPGKDDGKRLEGAELYLRLQGNPQLLKPKEVSLRAAFEVEGDDNLSADVGSSPPGKRCMNFRDLLASEGSEWESSSARPAGETTSNVDSVGPIKFQNLSSFCSDSKVLNNQGGLEVKDAASPISSHQETEQSDLPNDKPMNAEMAELKKHEGLEVKDAASPNSSCRETEQSDLPNDKPMNAEMEELKKHNSFSPAPSAAESLVAAESVVGREVSIVRNSNFLLPPPLPKSPSDSWLSRTLLATSSSKSSSSSSQSPPGTDIDPTRRTAVSKPHPTGTKWETIVRTSNVHHGHLRFSEELLPPVPDA